MKTSITENENLKENMELKIQKVRNEKYMKKMKDY